MFPHSFFKQATAIEKYTVEKRFYSKKNEVYKVRYTGDGVADERILVIKNYLQPKWKIKKEIDLLQLLKEKGLSVPQVFIIQDQYVIMEYIEGKTLLETIEEREVDYKLKKGCCYQSNQQLISALIEWLKNFYRYADERIILKDINLRNFIINNDGEIYGFDFEDCDVGKIKEDVGKLCAYILTYDPPFTPWKLEFAKEVFDLCAKEFHINQELLLEKVEEEIRNINIKRRKDFSMDRFDPIIK